ncbi:MAG: urea carboxylase-associated family protein [Gammaproteobacteria bacterium]|nr:urea carboxylase-associated family protein [Gammaproteobacteria bacterium]
MKENLLTIPARQGVATPIERGQSIRLVNTHGTQVVDFWVINARDSGEFLSMEHLRAGIQRLIPRVGDALVTNRRRGILQFMEDSSPGVHDTLLAACDTHRYAQLGCEGYHDNCTDNFFAALRTLEFPMRECPSPFNLWMNIPWSQDGSLDFHVPACGVGDHLVFRAEMDCIAVMSACPMDILPINDHKTLDAHYEVLPA